MDGRSVSLVVELHFQILYANIVWHRAPNSHILRGIALNAMKLEEAPSSVRIT